MGKNYIKSEGPFSEINEREGTEIPYWTVTEFDDNDNEVKDHGKFYSLECAVNFADAVARRKRIEHIEEALCS